MIPTVYLAGAIRDGRNEDIIWREQLIEAIGDRARVLSPLACKSYNATTKRWLIHGFVEPSADFIVKHDLWMVRQADIVVGNVISLAEGYPSIGTLIELGGAAILNKVIYLLLAEGYRGHQNQEMYRVHPFLERNAAAVFSTLEELEVFLPAQLDVMNGSAPSFAGTL
jgi:nucleoside 2-deoxyribosyltransferase